MSRFATALFCAFLCALSVDVALAASGITIQVNYDGQLGPVNASRPLCLCIFYDSNLEDEAGCFISSSNGPNFRFTTGDTSDYYFVAFLDLQRNEVVDANEPFEIFENRGAPPAIPVTAQSGYTAIAMDFGDENLPPPCLGDCDHSGEVSAEEITALVTADLDASLASSCDAGDGDLSGTITVDEIVNAVSHLGGVCL
jgi:hypothetical protein